MNQNQTHQEEIAGGFMWSPRRNANGARNQFYDNMELVSRGDVVFSYYGARIQHIGVVTSPGETAPKPAFGSGGENWADEGWLVGVEFSPVQNPFRPKDAIEQIRHLLPTKYSPLQPSGDGLQSVYLASVSPELAEVLMELAQNGAPGGDARGRAGAARDDGRRGRANR